jgi:hypothetical protein
MTCHLAVIRVTSLLLPAVLEYEPVNSARKIAWAPHWVMGLNMILRKGLPSIEEERARLRSMSQVQPKEEAFLYWGPRTWAKATRRLQVYELILLTMQA